VSGATVENECFRPRHVLLHPRRLHDRHRLLQLHRKCNVRELAELQRSIKMQFCNTLLMCVAYPTIDVQLELENACFKVGGSRQAADPRKVTFAAGGIQAGSTQPRALPLHPVLCLTPLQFGQPRHFVFKLQHSGSFSVRAVAIVNGSSTVALTCVDPEPKFPLLTEQRALASYLQAIGKCISDATARAMQLYRQLYIVLRLNPRCLFSH
jgi:hypothetical protein